MISISAIITNVLALQTSIPSSGQNIPLSAWKVIPILSSVATMVMYAETVLVPAIPDLIRDFSIPYNTSSWILTTYLLTGAVMTPIAGKLSDIYGKKKILLIIMMFYTVGVSIAGFSSNLYFMLIARGMQGIGMSMFPIAFSIARAQFPREKMAIGQGIITSMYAGGAVIGLSIGGFIIQNYGWHSTFFTIIPIAIGLLFTISRFIHVDNDEIVKQKQGQKLLQNKDTQSSGNIKSLKGKRSNRRITGYTKATIRNDDVSTTVDVKGAITLAFAITSFLLLLTFLQTGSSSGTDINNNISSIGSGSNSAILVICFLVLGIVSLVPFIVIEKRSKSPLVDFSLISNIRMLPENIIIMIVGFSMFMIFQTMPIFMENPLPVGFGEDTINATELILPFA
jgi:MFS family permease